MQHDICHPKRRWDDNNTEHLAEHDIQTWEVDEVFLNRPQFFRNKGERAGDYRMAGRTFSGRKLTIVVKTLPESHEQRPITGWPSP